MRIQTICRYHRSERLRHHYAFSWNQSKFMSHANEGIWERFMHEFYLNLCFWSWSYALSRLAHYKLWSSSRHQVYPNCFRSREALLDESKSNWGWLCCHVEESAVPALCHIVEVGVSTSENSNIIFHEWYLSVAQMFPRIYGLKDLPQVSRWSLFFHIIFGWFYPPPSGAWFWMINKTNFTKFDEQDRSKGNPCLKVVLGLTGIEIDLRNLHFGLEGCLPPALWS